MISDIKHVQNHSMLNYIDYACIVVHSFSRHHCVSIISLASHEFHMTLIVNTTKHLVAILCDFATWCKTNLCHTLIIVTKSCLCRMTETLCSNATRLLESVSSKELIRTTHKPNTTKIVPGSSLGTQRPLLKVCLVCKVHAEHLTVLAFVTPQLG